MAYTTASAIKQFSLFRDKLSCRCTLCAYTSPVSMSSLSLFPTLQWEEALLHCSSYDIQPGGTWQRLYGGGEIFCFNQFPKTTFVSIVSKPDFESNNCKKLINATKANILGGKKKRGILKSGLCHLTEVNRDRPNQQA